MENHQHSNTESVYACPMHPEVTGKQGDKCSKCGMVLKAVRQPESDQYQVLLSTLPRPVEAGKPANLVLAIKENGHDVPLDISHEMKIHLMVVSEDLSWFRHIHPMQQADGTYTVTEMFPNGGKYFLFVDFKPSGGAQTLSILEIGVQGQQMAASGEDTNKWISQTDGYKVTLENGNDFKTNRAQHLKISVEKEGKKLSESDLQQYLGASAHIVMIGKADKDFLHIHPVSDSRYPVFAETRVGKAGIYRMWVQFKIDGQVHTADFRVDVAKGENNNRESHQGHHH